MNSLKWHLMRAQLIIVGIFLLISGGVLILENTIQTKRAMENRMDSIARILALNMAPALAFMDTKEGQLTLLSLKSEPGVLGAIVLDSDGQIFVEYGEVREALRFQFNSSIPHQYRDGHFVVSLPLEQDGSKIGKVILFCSLSEISHRWKSGIGAALLALVMGLSAAFALGNILQRSISQNVGALVAAIRKVSSTADYSLRLEGLDERRPIDEVEQLARAFNELLSQIELRESKLEAMNAELEHKIRDRTSDLDAANRELHARFQKLSDAQAMLMQSERMAALGEMAGGVAHEINNPLAIIHGNVERLKVLAGNGQLDMPTLLKFSDRIGSTALRISKIVKSLRAFARDGEHDPFSKVPVHEVFEDLLELCRERLKYHEVELLVEPIPDDSILECRPIQIGQVLLNLVNNAHDAVQSLDTKWIHLRVRDSGDWLEISVVDSGTGIPAELRHKILQPFFTTKELGKGTGLGLSVSKGIIESHGGTLTVDDTSPNTCFVICLPKRQASPMAA